MQPATTRRTRTLNNGARHTAAQPLSGDERDEINAALATQDSAAKIGGRLECVQPERVALTARQRAILEWIRGYILREGAPPALREIGKAFGIRSTNGVNDHLRALERKGYIRRRDMLSRSIVVLEGAPGVLSSLDRWREENRCLRALLQRVHDTVCVHPHLSARMAILLGDVRAVLKGEGLT